MEFIPSQIWAIGLVFARIGALLMVAPGIGDTTVPPRVRLLLALMIALMITPLVSAKLPALPESVAQTYLLILLEILIGLAIGGVLRIIFSALSSAGAIAGIQTGLSFAMTMDPTQGSQGAIFSSFLSMIGVTLLMQANLHHWFIVGALNSYNLFAAGEFKTGATTEWMLVSVTSSFNLAVQMMVPLVLYGIIFNIALGIVNRAAPAIQVFFIAQPVQVFIGMMLFMLSLGAGMLVWLEAMSKTARALN